MIALLVVAALAGAAPAPAPTSISGTHYSIEVPAGYEATDVSPPMMDFVLYRVTRQGSKKVGCTLYVGNHPGFPKLQWSQKPVETKAERRTTKALQRPGAIEGLIEFSGLTYKGSPVTPYTRIHYMADNLDEVAAKDMLRMIASIKVARPHLD